MFHFCKTWKFRNCNIEVQHANESQPLKLLGFPRALGYWWYARERRQWRSTGGCKMHNEAPISLARLVEVFCAAPNHDSRLLTGLHSEDWLRAYGGLGFGYLPWRAPQMLFKNLSRKAGWYITTESSSFFCVKTCFVSCVYFYRRWLTGVKRRMVCSPRAA